MMGIEFADFDHWLQRMIGNIFVSMVLTQVIFWQYGFIICVHFKWNVHLKMHKAYNIIKSQNHNIGFLEHWIFIIFVVIIEKGYFSSPFYQYNLPNYKAYSVMAKIVNWSLKLFHFIIFTWFNSFELHPASKPKNIPCCVEIWMQHRTPILISKYCLPYSFNNWLQCRKENSIFFYYSP